MKLPWESLSILKNIANFHGKCAVVKHFFCKIMLSKQFSVCKRSHISYFFFLQNHIFSITVESGFSKQLFSKYSGFSKYFSADRFFTT